MLNPEIKADELAEVIAGLYNDRGQYAVIKQEAERSARVGKLGASGGRAQFSFAVAKVGL